MPKRTDKNHSEIVRLLRQRGAIVYDTHALPNFVDAVVVYKGLAVLAEIKSPGGKLTQSQQKMQDEAGPCFYILQHADDVDSMLLEMLIKSERIDEAKIAAEF
jgi:hypothetical protein